MMMTVRVVAFLLALVLLSTAVLAQKSITTGSTKPNAEPIVTITVSGATGDGNVSLKDAIVQELANKGVGVAEKSARAYRVECVVAPLGPAKDGQQSIHIEWSVRKASGQKIGIVSQRNEIPAGSIDGEWGMTAKAAAGAAAQGIVRLLPP